MNRERAVLFVLELSEQPCEHKAPFAGQFNVDCEAALARPKAGPGGYPLSIDFDVTGRSPGGYILAPCVTCRARRIVNGKP